MTISRSANIALTGAIGATTQSTAAYNQPAGEHICVMVTWEQVGGGTAPISVTDTAGNTYTARTAARGSQGATQIWDAVAPCLGNAANVIKATWASAQSFQSICGSRYATSIGATIFVAQNTGVDGGGTSTTPATGSFTAGNMAFAGLQDFAGSTVTSSNAGWTTQADDHVSSGCVTQDRIDTPGGSITAGFTLGTASNWAMSGAAYREPVLPFILVQPTSQRQKVNTQARFSVSAIPSSGSNSYQWAIDKGAGYVNVGTNSATYTTPALQTTDAGNVKCTITDSNGPTVTNIVALGVYDLPIEKAQLRKKPKRATGMAMGTDSREWW